MLGSLIFAIAMYIACLVLVALIDNDDKAVTRGFIIAFLILVCFLISGIAYNYGIKKGQIEALTGVIKYELVTHPDSTKTWEEIKGIEK